LESSLAFEIRPQPSDVTCGPTCLHAVYRYFGDDVPLRRVIAEVDVLEGGGTLAVFLGRHALARGYRAVIYTYNLTVFDPTWFAPGAPPLQRKLEQQMRRKREPKLLRACAAYLDFLAQGGEVRCEELTPALLRRYLVRGLPILTGLNATYLYNCARERQAGARIVYDDIGGESTGHFVVVHGYDRRRHLAQVADPNARNPLARTRAYRVSLDRLLGAIMLGIVTYDANLLVLQPPRQRGV
jgi:hypothetical protein